MQVSFSQLSFLLRHALQGILKDQVERAVFILRAVEAIAEWPPWTRARLVTNVTYTTKRPENRCKRAAESQVLGLWLRSGSRQCFLDALSMRCNQYSCPEVGAMRKTAPF